MSDAFEQLISLGQVEKGLFTAVEEACGPERLGDVYFNRDGGGNYSDFSNRDRAEIFLPLTDWICRKAGGEVMARSGLVRCDYDTRSVQPGNSQARSSDWHIDWGGTDVLIANIIPTEFLVNDGSMKLRGVVRRHQLRRAMYRHKRINLPDGDLPELGLRVFQPADLEVVVMKDNVHRSPVNSSNETTARTWMRFTFF